MMKSLFFHAIIISTISLHGFTLKINAIDSISQKHLTDFDVYCDYKFLSYSYTMDFTESVIDCRPHIFSLTVDKAGYKPNNFEIDFSDGNCHDTTVTVLMKRVEKPSFFPAFHFEEGSNICTENNLDSTIEDVKQIIIENPGCIFEICGFADSSEIQIDDSALALSRAYFIYQALVRAGIDENRLSYRAKRFHPFVTYYSEYINEYFEYGDVLSERYILSLPEDIQDKARMLNRRVEISVLICK